MVKSSDCSFGELKVVNGQQHIKYLTSASPAPGDQGSGDQSHMVSCHLTWSSQPKRDRDLCLSPFKRSHLQTRSHTLRSVLQSYWWNEFSQQDLVLSSGICIHVHKSPHRYTLIKSNVNIQRKEESKQANNLYRECVAVSLLIDQSFCVGCRACLALSLVMDL